MTSFAHGVLAKMPTEIRIEPMTVEALNPFVIVIGTTSVEARALSGQAFNVGQTGFCLWQPPLPPLAFTTTNDTGWVNVSYDAGFSAGTPGQLAYRKLGNRVFLRGGATRAATYPTDGTLYEVNASNPLPSGARPSGENHRSGTFGTSLRPASVEVSTGGVIKLGVWDDLLVAPAWIACSTDYLTT